MTAQPTARGLKSGDSQPCIVEGLASQRIVEQEKDSGLVVLGNNGQPGAEDLLLGSVRKQALAGGSTDLRVSTVCGA